LPDASGESSNPLLDVKNLAAKHSFSIAREAADPSWMTTLFVTATFNIQRSTFNAQRSMKG
jgi:hypothetical protein